MMSPSSQSQSSQQTPQMNSSSNSITAAPTNPSVMTYNPTYNKCLPKILSDLDCEMRVKQVLKCIEMMLTDGGEDVNSTPSSQPLSASNGGVNPTQGYAFSSFKLSSPTVNGQSPSPSPMLGDRQVPIPNKKVRRSEMDDESNVHLTPNITSLSLQQQSPIRNGVAIGNASPKNKIKINIAQVDDPARLSNLSPVQQPNAINQQLKIAPSPSAPDENSKFKQAVDKHLESKDGKQNVQLQHDINSIQYQQQQYILNHAGIPMLIPQTSQSGQPILSEDGRRMMPYGYDVNHQNMVAHLQQQQQIQQGLEPRRGSFNPYEMSKLDGRNPFAVDQAVLEQQRRFSYNFDPNQPQMMQQVHLIHQQQQQQQNKQQAKPENKDPHSSPIIHQQQFVDQANQRNEFSSSPSVAPLSDSNDTKHFKPSESDSQQVPSKPKDTVELEPTIKIEPQQAINVNPTNAHSQHPLSPNPLHPLHPQQQQYLTPLLTGNYPPPIAGTEEYNWIFSFLDDNQGGGDNQPIPQ